MFRRPALGSPSLGPWPLAGGRRPEADGSLGLAAPGGPARNCHSASISRAARRRRAGPVAGIISFKLLAAVSLFSPSQLGDSLSPDGLARRRREPPHSGRNSSRLRAGDPRAPGSGAPLPTTWPVPTCFLLRSAAGGGRRVARPTKGEAPICIRHGRAPPLTSGRTRARPQARIRVPAAESGRLDARSGLLAGGGVPGQPGCAVRPADRRADLGSSGVRN